MPGISCPFSALSWRQYPLFLATCLLVSPPPAPSRAASFQQPVRPFKDHNPDHQPSLPQYYYPSPRAVRGEGAESPQGAANSGRHKREWRYDHDGWPISYQESVRTMVNPGNGPGETSDYGPFMFGKWTSRNKVSKTKAQAYLASPFDYDPGLQGTVVGGEGFQVMPPFQPPPSSSHLPDLDHPRFYNFSSPFGSIGQRPTRASATNKQMKRNLETGDTTLGGNDMVGRKALQPRLDRSVGRRIMTPYQAPPFGSLGPDILFPGIYNIGKHQVRTPGLGFKELPAASAEKEASHNSAGRTGKPPYEATAYSVAKRIYGKRVAETADLYLGGYNHGRQRDGRGKRHDGQGQLFNAMPPFQPPPSSSLLPDLFRPHTFNDSVSVIGQRPTRPSATGRSQGERGLHSASPEPQGPNREGQQEPHRDGQDAFGHEAPYEQPTGQTLDNPHDLPTQGSDDSDVQQEQIHPRDVVVKIDTPRLQLTFRAIAPPYFTFENLLSQMATYIIPGFCVDLAVTRRDEHCDIVSHMAALQTDRQQTWIIKIVDTGGKVIWMNQCMPDARLFIVPGLRVYFKFGAHSLVPGPTFPVSTPGATPGDPEGSLQTSLPTSDSGWVAHGSPLAPLRRTSDNS